MLIDWEVKLFDKDKTMTIKWVFFDKQWQTKQEKTDRNKQYANAGMLFYI